MCEFESCTTCGALFNQEHRLGFTVLLSDGPSSYNKDLRIVGTKTAKQKLQFSFAVGVRSTEAQTEPVGGLHFFEAHDGEFASPEEAVVEVKLPREQYDELVRNLAERLLPTSIQIEIRGAHCRTEDGWKSETRWDVKKSPKLPIISVLFNFGSAVNFGLLESANTRYRKPEEPPYAPASREHIEAVISTIGGQSAALSALLRWIVVLSALASVLSIIRLFYR